MYYPPYQQPPVRPRVTPPPSGLTYGHYEERKEIRRLANGIGLALLGNRVSYLFFSLFAGLPLIMLGMFDIHDIYNGFSGFDPIGLTAFSMIIYSVCLFFPFFILARARKDSFNQLLPFERVGSGTTFMIVLVGLGICMGLNIQTGILATLGELIGVHIPIPESPYLNSVPYFILNVVTTALLPALLEEFAFRGVILGSLRKFGDGFAVIISALLFSLAHFYVAQLPMTFILGLSLGFILVKTNSLLPAILIHFFNNFFAVCMQALLYNTDELTYVLIYFGCILVLMVVGMLMVGRLDTKGLIAFPRRKRFAHPLKKRVAIFCSAGGMICVFIVAGLCIILAIAGVL